MYTNEYSKEKVSFFTKIRTINNMIKDYWRYPTPNLLKERDEQHFINIERRKLNLEGLSYYPRQSKIAGAQIIGRKKYLLFKKEMMNGYYLVKKQKRKDIIIKIKNVFN